ncbi:MAG: signal peptidase I [Eubacterium sp.]
MEEQNNLYESTNLEYETGIQGKEKKKKSDKKEEPFNAKKEILSWVKIIIIAVVIAFVINNFIIINANVPTGSMETTIMSKDRMIGLRTAYWFSDPQRGDIVIFKNPDNEKETFVKRLIGMPGDKVVIKDAKIYINDSKEPLKEDYLPEEWTRGNGSDTILEYDVPENSYFMLGDNRNISHDARYWTNTYVTRDQIIAKAELVYWPWGNKGLLKSADYAE